MQSAVVGTAILRDRARRARPTFGVWIIAMVVTTITSPRRESVDARPLVPVSGH